jgi:hypothetical protein
VFWAELAANGEATAYSIMNPEDLTKAWKARWMQMAARRVKAARG